MACARVLLRCSALRPARRLACRIVVAAPCCLPVAARRLVRKRSQHQTQRLTLCSSLACLSLRARLLAELCHTQGARLQRPLPTVGTYGGREQREHLTGVRPCGGSIAVTVTLPPRRAKTPRDLRAQDLRIMCTFSPVLADTGKGARLHSGKGAHAGERGHGGALPFFQSGLSMARAGLNVSVLPLPICVRTHQPPSVDLHQGEALGQRRSRAPPGGTGFIKLSLACWELQTITGRREPWNFEPDDLVRLVKEHLQEKEGIPLEQIK
jgi:hypothetical protein